MQRKRRDLTCVCERARSQSPHSTDAARSKRSARGTASKTGPREGGQEGGYVTTGSEQESAESAGEATQGADAHSQRDWSWAEASIWTERMLSALVNGVVVSRRASGAMAANGTA